MKKIKPIYLVIGIILLIMALNQKGFLGSVGCVTTEPGTISQIEEDDRISTWQLLPATDEYGGLITMNVKSGDSMFFVSKYYSPFSFLKEEPQANCEKFIEVYGLTPYDSYNGIDIYDWPSELQPRPSFFCSWRNIVSTNHIQDYIDTFYDCPITVEPPEPECIIDADCPDGWTCTNQNCIYLNEPPEPECTINADCEENQECSNQVCVDKEEEPEKEWYEKTSTWIIGGILLVFLMIFKR